MTQAVESGAMLAAALNYASLGYSVFPCAMGAKQPATKNGLHDATRNAEQINHWWTATPFANVAIATKGLLVVDLDTKDGKANQWLVDQPERMGELEAGPVSLTPRGGRHYLFRQAAGKTYGNTASKIAANVDTRGDGGYIIVPPSFVNGTAYRWATVELVPVDELPELPAWLCAMLDEARAPSDRSELVTPGNPIPDGVRNSTLASLAGAMRRVGMTEPEILAALRQTNADRCRPPLPDDEIRKIASSAARYEPDQNATAVVEHHATQDAQSVAASSIISAASLMLLELPDPKWIVPGIICEGLGILAGTPKIGKSWLALGIAKDVACGGLALGKLPVEPGRVLYLALEDNRRRLKLRLRKLLGGAAAPEKLDIATEWNRFDEGGLVAIEAWIKGNSDARLVIVDTLAKVKPRRTRNGDSYAEDYESAAGLKTLADRYGIAALCITHLRKAESEDPVEQVTGTLGLTGAADSILVAKRSRGNSDATLFVTGRDVEEQSISLKWAPENASWSLLGDASKYGLSNLRLEILDAIRYEPLSAREVSVLLDKPYETVRKTMMRMRDDSQVISCGGKFSPFNNIASAL